MYVRKYSIPPAPARRHKPLSSPEAKDIGDLIVESKQDIESTFYAYAPVSFAALPDAEKAGLSKESDLAPELTATLPDASRAVNFVIPHTFTNYQLKLLNRGAEYSDYAASMLMYLSAWSYSEPRYLESMLELAGINDLDCVEVTSKNDPMFICATAQVLRSNDGKLAIVCFRGTEPTNVISWLTDASVSPLPAYQKKKKGGRGEATPDVINVHGGFLRNLQAIWPGVVAALRKNVEKLKALYICGHSLGGAMAVLAALSVFYSRDEDEHQQILMDKFRGVYTYGQPMIMSGEPNLSHTTTVPSLVEAVTYRHVFHQDPVPHLPPQTTGHWRHFGSERRLEVGQKDWTLCSEECYSTQILSILLAGVIGIIKFVTDQLNGIPGISFVDKCLPWNFNDHSPWGYVMNLAPEEQREAAIPQKTYEGSTASKQGKDMVTSAADFIHAQ